MIEFLFGIMCTMDEAVARTLGLSPSEYALVLGFVTGALAWGFLAAWFLMFPRLRRAGFARPLQRMVWWFALVVALTQMSLIFLKGVGIEPVPCPWPTIAMLAAAILFILTAYGFHIQNQNKGSGFQFINMVALPALGEVAATARYTVSGALKMILAVVHLLA